MNKPFPAMLLFGLLAAAPATADTFKDVDAGIEIDLPEGYAEQNRQHREGVTSLSLEIDAGPAITLVLIPIEAGFDSIAELFESQMVGIESGLGGPATVRELHDFDLGSYPARWGWLERTLGDAASVDVGVGTVEFDDVQAAFLVAMTHDLFARWGGRLEAAFLTLRPLGMPAGSVSNKVAATRLAPEAGPVDTPASSYQHPLFTLDLPAGWSATTNATNPRAINMASLAGPDGSSLIVMCLTGLGASRKTMDQATRGSLSNSLPNIRHVREDSFKAANGKVAGINVFQGRTEAEGTTVVLDGLTASVKQGKCWLGFIGFSSPTDGDRRLNDMLEIIRSVH